MLTADEGGLPGSFLENAAGPPQGPCWGSTLDVSACVCPCGVSFLASHLQLSSESCSQQQVRVTQVPSWGQFTEVSFIA